MVKLDYEPIDVVLRLERRGMQEKSDVEVMEAEGDGGHRARS
jgi:hypothetical protein